MRYGPAQTGHNAALCVIARAPIITLLGGQHASEACKRRVLEKASAGPCDRATALQCSRVVRVGGR